MKKQLLISLLLLSFITSFSPTYADNEELTDSAAITETTEAEVLETDMTSEELSETEGDVEELSETAEETEEADALTGAEDTETVIDEEEVEEDIEEPEKEVADYKKVYIDCPDAERLQQESYTDYLRIMMRYADDKTPIALSMPYDGRVWATIPAENEGRPLEYFLAEEKTFSDEPSSEEYDERSYNFYIMRQLSRKGIITGNEKDEARPLENVTRAEAVAMTMRFLGVDNMPDKKSGFVDVPEDAWYAAAVTKARKLGIVSGIDKTHFAPSRNISREEIVSLVARCLWACGYQKEIDVTREELLENVNFSDGEEISKWALSAYQTLKTYGTADFVTLYLGDSEEDAESFWIAKPKTAATRFFVAFLLLEACDCFQVYPSKTAISLGFDKELPRIDGSTSTYPFTDAVFISLFSNGSTSQDKPEKHSKSHASYERLINGEVDMLFASVYPASDILQLAEDSGVELELIPIAYDAMIFFTNIENPVKGLTKTQISDIYVLNNYSNWKDLDSEPANLYPFCRNNDSGSHAQMERHFLNGHEINEGIRKENTSVSMSNILTDVMNSQTDDPKGYGLGYSIYYYFQNMDEFYDTNQHLKLLEINGVYPDDETIASGEYPLSNNTYVVLRKDEPEDSPARRMADFMLTKEGQQCVEDAGFGPINPPYTKEFYLRNVSSHFNLTTNDTNVPLLSISCRYPKLVNKKNASLANRANELFEEISKEFENRILSYRESIEEYYNESTPEEKELFPFENYLTYNVTKNTDGIFSITFETSVYTGGIHPYIDKESHTYDTQKRKELTLSDLLRSKKQEDTDKFVIEKFSEKYAEEELWDLEEEAPFVNFYLENDDIVLYFGEYQIGPYALGCPEVRMPLSELTLKKKK